MSHETLSWRIPGTPVKNPASSQSPSPARCRARRTTRPFPSASPSRSRRRTRPTRPASRPTATLRSLRQRRLWPGAPERPVAPLSIAGMSESFRHRSAGEDPVSDAKIRQRVRYVKAPSREAGSDTGAIAGVVKEVLAAVRAEADRAVRRFAKKFDGVELDRFEVSPEAKAQAVAGLDPQTRRDTEFAIERVRAFAEAAARHHPAAGSRAPAGPFPRPPGDPDRAHRGLCARRTLSAPLGARHDDRAGQGRRLRRGDRLPAARRARGDGRGLPALRRRPDFSGRRRPGHRRDGLRD